MKLTENNHQKKVEVLPGMMIYKRMRYFPFKAERLIRSLKNVMDTKKRDEKYHATSDLIKNKLKPKLDSFIKSLQFHALNDFSDELLMEVRQILDEIAQQGCLTKSDLDTIDKNIRNNFIKNYCQQEVVVQLNYFNMLKKARDRKGKKKYQAPIHHLAVANRKKALSCSLPLFFISCPQSIYHHDR